MIKKILKYLILLFSFACIATRLLSAEIVQADTGVELKEDTLLFLKDYIAISLIVIFGIIISIFMILRSIHSSKKNISFGELQSDFSPMGISEPTQSKKMPSMQLRSGYSSMFSKAKNMNVTELVSKVRKIISAPSAPSNINLYKTAKEFQEIQQEIDKRLSKCVNLIDNSALDEAANMAMAYPSLIDLVNDINFKDFDKWMIYCRKSGLPCPDRMSIEDIEKLKQLLNQLSSENIENSMKMRKFVGTGNLKAAIELLETTISINPSNKNAVAQLQSLQATYFDRQITQISTLAQESKHKEAMKLYDELSAMIPDSVKANNNRWAKVTPYAREIKLENTKKITAETMALLRDVDPFNWVETFELVFIIDDCLENFPELKKLLDLDFIENKKTLAIKFKNQESEDKKFKDLCSLVIAFIEDIKYSFKMGKASKEFILSNLDRSNYLFEELKLSSKEIPVDIYDAYDKCVNFLRKELALLQRRKKQMISSVMFVFIAAVVGVISLVYNNNLKLDAYQDYLALHESSQESLLKENILIELDAKYYKYIGIAEFIRVRNEILNEIYEAKRIDESGKEFVSDIKPYSLEKLKNLDSVQVKQKEEEFNFRYLDLKDKVSAEVYENMLSAMKIFTLSLKNYKEILKNNISEKRHSIIIRLEKIKRLAEEKYSEGIQLKDEISQAKDLLKKLTLEKDVYVEQISQHTLDTWEGFIREISEKSEVISQINVELSNLENISTSSLYSTKIKELEAYCIEKGITDGTLLQKLKKINLKIDRLLMQAGQYYLNQSTMLKDLASGRNLISNSGSFEDISLLKNKDAFGLDFSEKFPLWLRNIYLYNYESYRKSPTPVIVKPFYTVSKASITSFKDDSSNGNRYLNGEILGIEDIETTVKALNFTDVTELETTTTYKLKSIKFVNSDNVQIAKNGEAIVFKNMIKESSFLGNIYNRIYDENMQDVVEGVSLLKIITEIATDDDININFKVFLLLSFMDLIDKYAPIESGAEYSPSLKKLKMLLGNPKNKALEEPLSWAKSKEVWLKTLNNIHAMFITVDTNKSREERIEASIKNFDSLAIIKQYVQITVEDDDLFFINISTYPYEIHKSFISINNPNPFAKILILDSTKINEPSEELEAYLDFIKINKISFYEEAKLCLNFVSKAAEPKLDLVAYFNADGKVKMQYPINSKQIYFYFDSSDALQCSRTPPQYGMPFSPIIALKEIEDYFRGFISPNSNTDKYIYEYLF